MDGIVSEKIYKVKQVHLPVVEALAADDIKNVGSLILSHPELQDDIRKKLCTTIQEEIRFMSLKSSNSILRKTNFEDLEFFSIQVILDEWKEKAPTFYQFLLACISNPSQQRNKHKKNDALLPGLVSAGSKLLSLYNQELNLYQHINSIILWRGGCKKSAFTRLNTTNDSSSYRASLDIVDKLGHKWQEDLNEWQEEVVEGTSKENNLTNQISMIRESIDLLGANPEVLTSYSSYLTKNRN